MHPDNGDAEGGTLVRINVSGVDGTAGMGSFANGSDYRCRFAAAVSPAAEAPDALQRARIGHVPATFDPTASSLLCTAPPMAGALSAFRVTLNGQQYGAPLSFGVHAAPSVSSLSPASGPFGGGTRVDVRGAGFDERGAGTGQLVCRFGEATSSRPHIYSDGIYNATVRAEWVGAGHVRCVAPHADMAEQERRLHMGFDSAAPPRLDDGTVAAVTLYGNASISGGALRLTERHPGQLGAYVIEVCLP